MSLTNELKRIEICLQQGHSAKEIAESSECLDRTPIGECTYRATLAALEVQLRKYQWQPIETAPEGVSILVYDSDYHDMMVADRKGDDWYSDNDYIDDEVSFTHWMPLPDPPKAGE